MTVEHFTHGCTCTYAGEATDCPHHGYEAVIRAQHATIVRLSDALGRIARMDEKAAAPALRVARDALAR